jgi:hypothetical protein
MCIREREGGRKGWRQRRDAKDAKEAERRGGTGRDESRLVTGMASSERGAEVGRCDITALGSSQNMW